MRKVLAGILLTLSLSSSLFAQQKAMVKGRVLDDEQQPIEAANVAVVGEKSGTITDSDGQFSLEVPADTDIVIGVSHISYQIRKFELRLSPGETRQLQVSLEFSNTPLPSVTVQDEGTRSSTMEKIDPKLISVVPNPSGNIETILKSLPGVVSTNELSSTYAVRGGNYDENLIYVNNIEVYRPLLYSSGQQEGMSFVNSKMVNDLSFSAGGFSARYGDKMSSVLDVKYRKPYSYATSVDASLLGLDVHTEGSPGSHRLTYLFGFRHRRNNYLLNSLDTKGQYQPRFTDFQSYLTYDITENWEISGLLNIANNRYQFKPGVRETEFGTLQQALKLTVYFDGQEVSNYQTVFGAVTNTFTLGKHHKLDVIVSKVTSFEEETGDVQGEYYIDELDKDLSNVGDVAFNRGVGTYLDHTRNRLQADWLNFKVLEKLDAGNHHLEWGVQYRDERIEDHFNEWVMIDSAGFSQPKNPDTPGDSISSLPDLELYEVVKSRNTVHSFRTSIFLVDEMAWYSQDRANRFLAIGARAAYWSFNDEWIVSPRATFTVEPKWKRKDRFQISAGVYQQQPFYREMRNLQGQINPDIKSQKSIQVIAGNHYYFKAWNRPFKFSTEVYYKWMYDLIPYIIDNVRIRYYGTNNSRGYATGIDFKVNGEFVKNAESWFSLSFMQTREDILDDSVVYSTGTEYPGYIPRPTDQRVNFSIFFQDYLPNNPTLKFNITLHYATGLAFGAPYSPKYTHTLRIPPYRRVDIGMSKLLVSDKKERPKGNPLRHFKSVWLSAEVFNVLGISNTISYLWVKDVTNTTYAVPNYLTQRLVNLKLSMTF